MLDVSCRERRAPRQRDAGDLCVANVDWLPRLLAHRCQCSRRGRSNSAPRVITFYAGQSAVRLLGSIVLLLAATVAAVDATVHVGMSEFAAWSVHRAPVKLETKLHVVAPEVFILMTVCEFPEPPGTIDFKSGPNHPNRL